MSNLIKTVSKAQIVRVLEEFRRYEKYKEVNGDKLKAICKQIKLCFNPDAYKKDR